MSVEVSYGPAELESALETVLETHDLTEYVAEVEEALPLPIFMRASEGFGCASRTRALSLEEFVRWRARCEGWAEAQALMLSSGADHATSSLSLEKVDGTRTLVVVAERCPELHSISLRGGTLTDAALASIAIAMRGRLRSLDLRGTSGFGDLGLKAIAAFSEGLQLLRLGGCAVTDAGVEKVCLFCHELRLLEVPDSPAVSTTSFSHLSKDCKVERVAAAAAPSAAPSAADVEPREPPAERKDSAMSVSSSGGSSSGEHSHERGDSPTGGRPKAVRPASLARQASKGLHHAAERVAAGHPRWGGRARTSHDGSDDGSGREETATGRSSLPASSTDAERANNRSVGWDLLRQDMKRSGGSSGSASPSSGSASPSNMRGNMRSLSRRTESPKASPVGSPKGSPKESAPAPKEPPRVSPLAKVPPKTVLTY
jgi:hypothetical protein